MNPSSALTTSSVYVADEHQVSLFEYKLEKTSTSRASSVPDNVQVTGAPLLWKQGYQGQGVRVGVIDTGIDRTHPDLQGRVILSRNYVKDGATYGQYNMHGTHVAGTIAANGNIKGVAPLCSLIDYRVLDKNGSGSYAAINAAIRQSIVDGCHVINMSLGGSYDYPPMHDAIKAAVAANILVIVAAGNEGPERISYPGYYNEVVSVGAVNFDVASGTVHIPYSPWFSNSNEQVDVCADGWNVLSLSPGGGYATISGTSMASPCVAGVAALMIQRFQSKLNTRPTEAELFKYLKSTTVDVLDKGQDRVSGTGMVTFYPELPSKTSSGLIVDGHRSITVRWSGNETQEPISTCEPCVRPSEVQKSDTKDTLLGDTKDTLLGDTENVQHSDSNDKEQHELAGDNNVSPLNTIPNPIIPTTKLTISAIPIARTAQARSPRPSQP